MPVSMHLSASNAISFCQTSTAAAVLTVWPSGGSHLNEVHNWLETSGVAVVHSSSVPLKSPEAELLSVMALYDGEDWLESNCWYGEQPLPEGPPDGPFAGAKWKHALCFKQPPKIGEKSPESSSTKVVPSVLVLNIEDATSSLWRSKYQVRARLASLSGNPGNSCIHLTDEQNEGILRKYQTGQDRTSAGGGGMDCDNSYAYTCARALLHPASIDWLNSRASEIASRPSKFGGDKFRSSWKLYTDWLRSPPPTEGEEEDIPPILIL